MSALPPTAEVEVNLVRTFDVPRPQVFRAWTDPRQVARWWGPAGFTSPTFRWEARTGRPIRVVMRGPDGAEHPMAGVFNEVAQNNKIIFTTIAEDADGNPMMEARTTATFVQRDGKTTLTVRALAKGLAAASEILASLEACWSQSLQRLAEFTTPMQGETA